MPCCVGGLPDGGNTRSKHALSGTTRESMIAEMVVVELGLPEDCGPG